MPASVSGLVDWICVAVSEIAPPLPPLKTLRDESVPPADTSSVLPVCRSTIGAARVMAPPLRATSVLPPASMKPVGNVAAAPLELLIQVPRVSMVAPCPTRIELAIVLLDRGVLTVCAVTAPAATSTCP